MRRGAGRTGEVVSYDAWIMFQPCFEASKGRCIGLVGHGNPTLQDGFVNMLVLAKSSWPSVKDAHPNEYVDERFNVVACRVRRPISRIAAKDVDRHKWYCSLNKIDG